MKVAIVGASGFVGSRLVEYFVLGQVVEVVPVVRSFSSLALQSRFDLPWQVCDVMDPNALAQAFAGCDWVIHAALGDPGQIVRMAGSVYAAAQQAAVKRLVVLSSAAVHGLNPASGTDERTPIHHRQSMDYNNAKVRAEQLLLRARKRGRVELVMLRPSIIYGPRCRMFARLAEKLNDGTAFLINEGQGICNTVYVDNLIHAIKRAIEVDCADGETFLVGDSETVTWRDVYSAISQALGINVESIHRVNAPVFRRSFQERVEKFVATPIAQSLLPAFPYHAKRITKVMLGALQPAVVPDAWILPASRVADVDEEMATLQQCAWKYPNVKAVEILGYAPPVPFSEGMSRTLSWLKFAGYPVNETRAL